MTINSDAELPDKHRDLRLRRMIICETPSRNVRRPGAARFAKRARQRTKSFVTIPTSHGLHPQNLPQLTLPKGGGALKGIGEKFAVNPATGAASLSVPIYVPPGRGTISPALSLAYSSGGGNGPFGIGWSLDVPRIARKTEKGLPRYDDADDSDTFILSGAEDLVPAQRVDGQAWALVKAKLLKVAKKVEGDGLSFLASHGHERGFLISVSNR